MCRIASIALFLIMSLSGNTGQALMKSRTMEEFRPEGSKRQYIFFMKDTQVGQLISEYEGESEFEGSRSYRFDQELNLDFSSLGREYTVSIDGRHFVDSAGLFAGTDMTIKVNDQEQELYLEATADSILGHSIRGSHRHEIKVPLEADYFAADNNMIDLYELFLAFHDLNTGDTIYDTLFVPQTQVTTPVTVYVEKIDRIRYGRNFDSAYVCRFLEPTEQIAYFTRDRRLVRLLQPYQDLDVILYESPLDKLAPPKQAFSIRGFFRRLPLYVIYLVIGGIFAAPFLRRYWNRPELYVMLVMGGVVFVVAKAIASPLQRWFGENIMIPGIRAGGSLFSYAVITALMTGIIQEIFKLLPPALLHVWRHQKARFLVALGAMCGIGFGIYEAGAVTGSAWQTGTMKLVSAAMFERIFAILFHATAGAAVGFALSRGFRILLPVWAGLVVVHSFVLYLFVFLQKGVIDYSVLQITIALIDLILLLVVFLGIRRGLRN